MARYTGSVYKKSRRLGFSTLENGKELARRPYAPGIHGADRRKKLSEYGVQLQEKQKVRFMYEWSIKRITTNGTAYRMIPTITDNHFETAS